MGLAYSSKNKRTGEDFTISSVSRSVSYEGIPYKLDIQISKGKLGLNPFKRKKIARVMFSEYCTFDLQQAHKEIVDMVANLSTITSDEIKEVFYRKGYGFQSTTMLGTPFLLVLNTS